MKKCMGTPVPLRRRHIHEFRMYAFVALFPHFNSSGNILLNTEIMPTVVSGVFKYAVKGVSRVADFNLAKPIKLDNGKWLSKFMIEIHHMYHF